MMQSVMRGLASQRARALPKAHFRSSTAHQGRPVFGQALYERKWWKSDQNSMPATIFSPQSTIRSHSFHGTAPRYTDLAKLTPEDAEWEITCESLLDKPQTEPFDAEDWQTAIDLLKGLCMENNLLLELEENDVRKGFAILDRLCSELERKDDDGGSFDPGDHVQLPLGKAILHELIISWRCLVMDTSIREMVDEIADLDELHREQNDLPRTSAHDDATARGSSNDGEASASSTFSTMNVREEFNQVLQGTATLSSFVQRLWEQPFLFSVSTKSSATLHQKSSEQDRAKSANSFKEVNTASTGSLSWKSMLKRLKAYTESGLFRADPFPFSVMAHVASRSQDAAESAIAIERLIDWMEKIPDQIKVDEYIYAELLTAYRRAGQPETCDAAFRSMVANHRVSGIPVLFSIVISAWIESESPKKVPKAEALFLLLREQRLLIKEEGYSAMMNLYAKATDLGSDVAIQKCEQLLTDMQSNGIMPGRITLNALLSAYAIHQPPKAMQLGLQVVEDMKGSGLEPNVITHNTLLDICAKSGAKSSVSYAESIWEEMRTGGISPSNVSFGAMMNVYAKSRCSKPEMVIQKCEQLLVDMQSNGITPGLVTFNSLISAYATHQPSNAIQRGLQVLKDMKHSGLEPDVITYSALLDICAKSEDRSSVSEAETIWKQIGSSGFKTKIPLFNGMMAVYGGKSRYLESKIAIQKCEALLADMRANGFTPDLVTLNSHLSAYATHQPSNAVQRGLHVLKDMKDSGLEPDVVTYTILLDICAKSGDKSSVSEAESIWEEMKVSGIPPDNRTYGAMMNVYAKSKDADGLRKYEELMNEMHEIGISPNEITFSVLMNSHLQSGSPPEKIESIFQDITKSRPDIISHPPLHNIRLNSWSKAGNPEMAVKALRDMQELSSEKPDTRHFTMVLLAWKNSGRPNAAENCEAGLKQMMHLYETKGMDCLPNAYSYTIAMSCHFKMRSRYLGIRVLNILDFWEDSFHKRRGHGDTGPPLNMYCDAIQAQSMSSDREDDPALYEQNVWSLLERLEKKPLSFWKPVTPHDFDRMKTSTQKSRFRSKREMLATIARLESNYAPVTRGGSRDRDHHRRHQGMS